MQRLSAKSTLCMAISLAFSAAVQADVVPVNGSVVGKVGSATTIGIVAPDSRGTSYNSFSSFDALGVVVNNARENVETKLLGGLARNPALQAGTARTIVLDNIGDAPTRLNGLVEVGGDRADLLMVGRNGVVCNSCGFINTNLVTVGAGVALYDENGQLRLDTSQAGAGVQIRGAGLSAPDASVALVAQQIQLLAPVYGKEVALQIVKGIYGTEDRQTMALGEAFDSSLGDYAGVPNILADGTITLYTNARKLDAKNLTVSSTANINIESAGGDLDLTSSRFIANRALNIKGKEISLDRVSADSATFQIQADKLGTYGMFSSADSTVIQSPAIALRSSSLSSKSGTKVDTDQLKIDALAIVGNLDVNANSLEARGFDGQGESGKLRVANVRLEGSQVGFKKLDVESFETLEILGGNIRSDALTLNSASSASSVTLGAGSQLLADRLALSNLASFDASGDIALKGDLELSNVGRIGMQGGIDVQTLAMRSIAGGVVNTGNIRAGTTSLSDVGGVINSGRWDGEAMSLENAGLLTNTGDMTQTRLSLTGGTLDNSGRMGTATLLARRTGSLSNTQTGTLIVNDLMDLDDVEALRNNGRLIAGELRGRAVLLTDNRGDLAVGRSLALAGREFTTTGRIYAAGNPVSLDHQTLTLAGSMQAGNLTLAGRDVVLREWTSDLSNLNVVAENAIGFESARVHAQAGIALTAPVVNTALRTTLSGPLTVNAATQTLRDTDILGASVQLRGQAGAGAIDLIGVRFDVAGASEWADTAALRLTGVQSSSGSLAVARVGEMSVDATSILAAQTAGINAVQTVNNAGNLGAAQWSISDVTTLQNQGRLAAARQATLQRIETLRNGGEIAGGRVDGNGNALFTNTGLFSADGGSLAFGQWNNQGSMVASQSTFNYENFNNAAGATVTGKDALSIVGGSGSRLTNAGVLNSSGDLSLLGPDLRNTGRIETRRDLLLGRAAAAALPATHSFLNEAGSGTVTAGRDLIANVDNFSSAAAFVVDTQSVSSIEWAPNGTYLGCESTGRGSCRGTFNAAGGATVVLYGAGGIIPVYGVAGRNGAEVLTTTRQIQPGSYQDAPIRVGRDLQARALAAASSFDTYAATLTVGGDRTIENYGRSNTAAYVADQRVEKNFFTDVYYCYSDVACTNPSGNNVYQGRQGSYEGMAPTNVLTPTISTGGLRTAALAVRPDPAADLSNANAEAAIRPDALPALGSMEEIASGTAPSAAVLNLPKPDPVVVLVTPPVVLESLSVRAADFVFPTIPGELPSEQKLPVISSDTEDSFQMINGVRLREDLKNRSCYAEARGDDATSFNDNRENNAACVIDILTPAPNPI